MNKIEIRQVVTPFDKISLYEIFDHNKSIVERKLNEHLYGRYEGLKIIFDTPYPTEEINKLKYVDKIYFYPDEDKFEIMLMGELFKTIISKEYSILY